MDNVFESWLERQYNEGMSLCGASDLLTLIPETGPQPPRRFIAQFKCPTMVRAGTEVVRAEGFAALVQFPAYYLRSAPDAGQIVNLLAPGNVFHPNIAAPFICIGHIAPGTGLVELLYQVFEILTFQKMTPREDDALNHDACVWARRHLDLFPLTNAPLRRAASAFAIEEMTFEERDDESQGN